MKKLLILFFVLTYCAPHHYKKVVEITKETHTYEVTVTNQIGGDHLGNGAGGALVGGGLDIALGGSGTGGAIVGALIGAATTEDAKMESYKEMRTDTFYTVRFNDGTTNRTKNYLPYAIGDSVAVFK